MARSLATAMSAPATARTWVTPPAAPSTCVEAIVWTESTTSSEGPTASTWPRSAPSSVSPARSRAGSMASIRSARSLTWLTDSSPVT